MDKITKEHRSWNMSRIRSKNTEPEKVVRKWLLKKKLKLKRYAKDLPGKPDIIIEGDKIAFFVNGCFWHQHKGCKRQVMPKTNRSYWKSKLSRNVERLKRDRRLLKQMGWKTAIIWECQIKDLKRLETRILKILR